MIAWATALGASAILNGQTIKGKEQGSLAGLTRDGNWKQCRDPNPDVAIRGCTAVIQSGQETDEYLAIAFNRRGNAHQLKGDFDPAIEDYKNAIRLNPKYSLALNNRGNVYLGSKKDYDRALQDYDEVIRLEPTAPIGFFFRGAAYLHKLDFDSAIRDFDEAIRLDPGYEAALQGRATANIGKKDYSSALEDFESIIRLDPNKASGFDGRAGVRNHKEDWDGAIQDSNEAIRLNPSDAIAFDNRGILTAARMTLSMRSRTTVRRSGCFPGISMRLTTWRSLNFIWVSSLQLSRIL